MRVGRTDRPWRAYPRLSAAPQVRRLRTIVVWPLLLLLMRLAAWRPQHPKHSKTHGKATATPRPAPAQIFFNLFATTSATHFANSTEYVWDSLSFFFLPWNLPSGVTVKSFPNPLGLGRLT